MSSSPSPTKSPPSPTNSPPPPTKSVGANSTAPPAPSPSTNLKASPPPPPLPGIPVSILPSPPPPPTTTNPTSTPPLVHPPAPGGLPPGALAGLVLGIGLGAIMVLVAVGIFVFFYRKKKRKEAQLLSGGEQGPKDNFTAAPPQHWQHNTPSAGDKVTLLPTPSPPPGMVVAQWSPAIGTTLNESSSSSLGSEKPFPLLSPGIPPGFSRGTSSLEELVRATDGFSDANLLGQGGFGYVHKGVLSDGKVVAVKQLKAGSGQGEREFRAEIEIISRVHHRHLVSLVGYCITGAQRLLVYEFVPNKTLEFHLHGKGRPTMGWSTRMKIAIGSAKGLAYLHQDCHPKIIHRDIKAANILLDDGFEAKVADFGLAKHSLDTDTHVSTRVVGTFGYMAPEYASTGKLTDKSDVFSFGVVLLELITGRRPVDRTQPCVDESIVDWARPLLTKALEDGNYDALVDPNLEYDSTEMARMISCAAACVRHSARLRPQMNQIVRALEGNMSLDDLSDGITPGYSVVYSSIGSSDYSSSQYKEDMKKFRKIALESQELVTSDYSAPISDSDQHPSSSSTEYQRITPETDSQATDKTIKDSHDSS